MPSPMGPRHLPPNRLLRRLQRARQAAPPQAPRLTILPARRRQGRLLQGHLQVRRQVRRQVHPLIHPQKQ